MAARRGALVKLAVFALAISVVMLAATSASAQDELISIDSITITPGGGTTLEVNALNMPAPGLGAWSIGVEYGPVDTLCPLLQPRPRLRMQRRLFGASGADCGSISLGPNRR